MTSVAWIILAAVVGVSIGWGWAHRTVAQECERLGSFYVGSKVFHCYKIEDKNAERRGIPPMPGYSQKPPVRSPRSVGE